MYFIEGIITHNGSRDLSFTFINLTIMMRKLFKFFQSVTKKVPNQCFTKAHKLKVVNFTIIFCTDNSMKQ